MKILYLIPARGGSKGIPNKNIKLLGGKPLIEYSIETALQIASTTNDICVTTDSDAIAQIAKQKGLNVPFMRPAELASDTASSEDVIKHALSFYKDNLNKNYDAIVLLQPTSPLRKINDIKAMIDLFSSLNADMVVSVKESSENPYYSLFEENEQGYLYQSKPSNFTRRQDCPQVYTYNGSVYVINVSRFILGGFSTLQPTKFVMDDQHSIDIDNELDWELTEIVLKNSKLK